MSSLEGLDPDTLEQMLGAGGALKHVWVFRPAVEQKLPDTIAIQGPQGAARLLVAEAQWDGPARLVYRPEAPIAGGARLYLETRAAIEWTRGDGRSGVYR